MILCDYRYFSSFGDIGTVHNRHHSGIHLYTSTDESNRQMCCRLFIQLVIVFCHTCLRSNAKWCVHPAAHMHNSWIHHLLFQPVGVCVVKCYQFWIVLRIPVNSITIFQIDEQRIKWISFDLYCLSGTMRVRNISEKKRFGFYAIYAFGLSLLLTAMLPIVDSIDGFPDELKPRVGNDKCYLKSM